MNSLETKGLYHPLPSNQNPFSKKCQPQPCHLRRCRTIWILTQEVPKDWVEGIFQYIIRSKEKQSVGLPYEAMITKLLAIFNIDTMDETIDSTNQQINYTSLREKKVHIKYGELMDEPMVKEEDLEETENASKNKVYEICQSIAKDVDKLKRFIKRNDNAYGK